MTPPANAAAQTTVTLPEPGYISATIAAVVAIGTVVGLLVKGGKMAGDRLAQLDLATANNVAMKASIEHLSDKIDANAQEAREANRALSAHLDQQVQHILDAIKLIAKTTEDHERRLGVVEETAP